MKISRWCDGGWNGSTYLYTTQQNLDLKKNLPPQNMEPLLNNFIWPQKKAIVTLNLESNIT